MQVIKEDWWATPIWYFDIPIEEADYIKIAEECYSEKNKSEGRIISNKDGWQSNDIFKNKNIPNISNLINIIDVQTKHVFKDHGLKNNIDVGIGNSWININFKDSSNYVHTHSECIMSGVYYIKANENSGDTEFYGDSRLEFYNQLYFDNSNKNTFSSVVYKPIVGRVLIFPSWVPHSVKSNKSDEDRISISFNIVSK
jgi:uncharacterized protein (TIGR02466 family)